MPPPELFVPVLGLLSIETEKCGIGHRGSLKPKISAAHCTAHESLPRWFDVYLRGHIEDAHGAAHAIWPVIAIAIGILF